MDPSQPRPTATPANASNPLLTFTVYGSDGSAVVPEVRACAGAFCQCCGRCGSCGGHYEHVPTYVVRAGVVP